MFHFIFYLRSLAAVFALNSHYGAIWPISGMAMGGLLANVLFFAVSGFCNFNTKSNFIVWYAKRLFRILLTATTCFVLLRLLFLYGVLHNDALRLFVKYPTIHVFLIWLISLYPIYYLAIWLSKKFDYLLECLLVVFAIIAVFVSDKPYVPSITFLYFASMLTGAVFRKHYEKFQKKRIRNVVLLVVCFVFYAVSNVIYPKFTQSYALMVLCNLGIIPLLCSTFAVFISLEKNLSKFPVIIRIFIKHFGSVTLQVFLVQFAIIMRFVSLVFPLNFLVVTGLIFAVASVSYFIERLIYKFIFVFVKLFKFLLVKILKKENLSEPN